MKKRTCINCEKETESTPCSYCGGGMFRNITTPPVNESWKKEFQKEMLLLCWEIEKLPASEQQTKVVILAGKIKDNLKKFFGEQSTLLSTVRQEAKSKERESLLFTFETFLLNSPLREKWIEFSKQLKPIDSLTSKGGANGN